MGKLTVGALKESLRDLPDEASVNIMFETGFSQHSRAANSLVRFTSDEDPKKHSILITHELDCLPRKEWRESEYAGYELLLRVVLSNDNFGVNAPEVRRQFLQNCRKRWSKWWELPLPKDCPACDVGSLLPEPIVGVKDGFTWTCTKCSKKPDIVWSEVDLNPKAVLMLSEIDDGRTDLTISVVEMYNQDFTDEYPISFTSEEHGKEFYQKVLKPILEKSFSRKIRIDLDGSGGYSTSWLRSVFETVPEDFSFMYVRDVLRFKSNEEPLLIDEISEYMNLHILKD